MISLRRWLRSIPSWQITLGLALMALGFLVAAQLASEGPRIRYTTQERAPLIETVRELQAQQEDLKGDILALREQIQALEGKGEGSAQLVRELNVQLQEARIAAGLVALTGNGVVFRLEDAGQVGLPGGSDEGRVTARDIRTLVEELWLAGAEAIAVNNERVVGATAVIDIGGSVLVNSAYVAPPFQVSAIGPPDLYNRLSKARGFVQLVQERGQGGGIRFSFAELEVRVPAFAGSVNLTHARLEPAPSVGP